MGLDKQGMDRVTNFKKQFGEKNLSALFDELIVHYPEKAPVWDSNENLIWGLYSLMKHECLKESEVGTFTEYEIQHWVYHNIFYGYIAEIVGETSADIADLFNPEGIDFENDEYPDKYPDVDEDDEEEEEEQPVKRGLAKYDYLLKEI